MDEKAVDAQIAVASEQAPAELAREHTAEAVSTLANIMRNTKAPAGVRRQAAMDLLAQGWGRPESREADRVADRGLTINILKIATGETRRVFGVDPDEPEEIASAYEEAKRLLLPGD